jgi:hypothetical protein
VAKPFEYCAEMEEIWGDQHANGDGAVHPPSDDDGEDASEVWLRMARAG